MILFFFKQKTAYEMRISDWSSDVCSSDLFVAATGYVTDAKRRDGAVVFATPDANDADALNAGRWWKLRRDANWHRPDGMRDGAPNERSEEGRVGKECVSKCRSWWSTTLYKNKDKQYYN